MRLISRLDSPTGQAARAHRVSPVTARAWARRFKKGAIALIEGEGANKIPSPFGGHQRWRIQTASGAVTFSFWNIEDTGHPHTYDVFARWDNPKLAKKVQGNKFSGKWNFHVDINKDQRPEPVLDDFARWLRWGLETANYPAHVLHAALATSLDNPVGLANNNR